MIGKSECHIIREICFTKAGKNNSLTKKITAQDQENKGNNKEEEN